jgi:hypothetical protein
MLTEAADRTSARQLWRQILTADEDWLRKRAQRGLQQIDALDQIEVLSEIVRKVPPPGTEPYSWALLIRTGALRSIPVDPAGAQYEIDPATGRIDVSRRSPLFPLPQVKGRRP